MANVRQYRDRGTEKNRRHDLGRGYGGSHFDPRLARKYDCKLVKVNGRRIWRDPEPA